MSRPLHLPSAGFRICTDRGTWAKFRRARVKKYFHVINIGLQNNLQYRVNYLTRTLFSFIPLFAMLSLWRVVYEQPHGASGSSFSKEQMMFYYLLVAVVDVLTAVNEDDWQIAADIREGNISQFLLKPVDYLWYRLCLFFSGRIAFIAVAALPLLLFIWLFRQYVMPPVNLTAALVFPVSLVLTALLQFFISYAMAMLAFWLLEISTFIFILFAFEYLASGHLFPLDILPPALKATLFFTPFPYQLYFPISVYLGKVTGPELWRGLTFQLLWVLAAYCFARWMWRRGIKKYSAFGG
ncbi:MAG TPA: ABC-2 family transporter protein [Verrucomicrobiae bacterium]